MRRRRGDDLRRPGTALLIPAALAATLAGCGAAPAANDASTITVAYIGDERLLSPYWDMPAKFLVFLPLFERDSAGEIRGVLARSWQHSEDFRTWTYHLRTDVFWEDGVPTTAHDVKFTLDLAKDPGALFASIGSDSVEVVDDSTVTIRYRGGANPQSTWHVFYPRHLLEGLDPDQAADWEFWRTPVGNGPYRLARHVPKTMMEFQAKPDYVLGEPRIPRVVLRLGGNSLTELMAGNVDVLTHVTGAEVPKLRADPRFSVYHEYNTSFVLTAAWNPRDSLFADPRVRKALTMAIDRPQLARLLDYPEGPPVTDVVYTSAQFYRGELPPALPHDTAAASRLLTAAGWRDADGDGVRERDGVPFRFGLMADGERQRAAVYVQEQLRRVGVLAEIDLRERVNPGTLSREPWQAAVVIAVNGPSSHWRTFGSAGTRPDLPPELVALVDSAYLTLDPDRRDALYRRMWPLFQELHAHTYLVPGTSSFVAHRRVKGIQPPYRADVVWYMKDMWLEPDS